MGLFRESTSFRSARLLPGSPISHGGSIALPPPMPSHFATDRGGRPSESRRNMTEGILGGQPSGDFLPLCQAQRPSSAAPGAPKDPPMIRDDPVNRSRRFAQIPADITQRLASFPLFPYRGFLSGRQAGTPSLCHTHHPPWQKVEAWCCMHPLNSRTYPSLKRHRAVGEKRNLRTGLVVKRY